MGAPFHQQIDKESGMLGEIKSRDGLAAHYDVKRVALLAGYCLDAVGLGACGRLRNNHDSPVL
jgi:hypothetical protein